MDVTGGRSYNAIKNRSLSSQSAPPAWRPFPPVNFLGKSSVNKMSSALILALSL